MTKFCIFAFRKLVHLACCEIICFNMSEYRIVISRVTQSGIKLDYELDTAFFAAAPEGSVREADIDVHLDLYKVKEGIRTKVQLYGSIGTNCDRCLQEIDYPLNCTESLLYTTSQKLVDENPTTAILLEEEQTEIDFSQDLYDLSLLQLPHKRVCEDVNQQCDQDALEAIEQHQKTANDDSIDPRWEALRDLQNNN